MPGRRAVVLLSGGLDSATAFAAARAEGFECYALSFDYGQRHDRELESARRVAAALGAKQHLVLRLDLRAIGGSALTADIPVPKGRSGEAIGIGIPVTYVPARNTVFLSHALAWAEVLESSDIFIGANALDYSVSGDSQIWVHHQESAELMSIERFHGLEHSDYHTIAVDLGTLQLQWRRVTARLRHPTAGKRCFKVLLERGHEITITEDHSLFTLDLGTNTPVPVKGSSLEPGMPIATPFDLSGVAAPWRDDLPSVDLSALPSSQRSLFRRRSLKIEAGRITNRLGRTRIPIQFPLTDDFLYIVGLWLAEGGKELDSRTSTLALSIGGIPGAVKTLTSFLAQFDVSVSRSSQNNYDYAIHSSVMAALFRHVGLYGTAKRAQKKFPGFFWRLSQRQRRVLVAGLWDGDGSHVLKGEAIFAQKSHALVDGLYHCLLLDGIFPSLKKGAHQQKLLILRGSKDFRRFSALYPLRHTSKRNSLERAAARKGRDQTTGLWKCPGLWDAVAAASLPPGEKTRIYNSGGKYDISFRAQRSAFRAVPALKALTDSRLAFLRVIGVQETALSHMYDLSVEGAENFVANGILAHNSGYPDCRPEYIEAFERMANLATKAGVEGTSRLRIHTPLIRLTKGQIVRRGVELGVDFALTWSCYEPEPDGRACGLCDSCLLRRKGFAEAGLSDPVPAAH
jgi:queuosine biosynthesis protein QueC